MNHAMTPGAQRAQTFAQPSAESVLTFALGAEEYAIALCLIREIREYSTPTRIVGAPSHMPGVLYLRGEIIPLVDLRVALIKGCPAVTPSTAIIIVEHAARPVGLVVDAVHDVLMLTPGQIKPSPAAAEYLAGIGAVDGRMILLADPTRLLSGIMGTPAAQVVPV